MGAEENMTNVKIRTPEQEELRKAIPTGIRKGVTTSGIKLLEIFFWADPSKSSDEWEELDRRGQMPEDYAREMYHDETVSSGRAVYIAYRDRWHCPEEYRRKPFPIIPGSSYVAGWDCGRTINPAFVLLQIEPNEGRQIQQIGELVAPMGTTAWEFCSMVRRYLEEEFPNLYYYEILHAGDPDINARSGNAQYTARQILASNGFRVTPMTNVLHVRLANVSRALSSHIEFKEDGGDGNPIYIPQYVVSEYSCPITVQGFRGFYKLPPLPEGTDPSSPDAVQRPEPVKNHPWSDVHDALQYAMTLAWKLIDGRGIKVHKRGDG